MPPGATACAAGAARRLRRSERIVFARTFACNSPAFSPAPRAAMRIRVPAIRITSSLNLERLLGNRASFGGLLATLLATSLLGAAPAVHADGVAGAAAAQA